MKKFLTLIALLSSTSLWAQVSLSEDDLELLEKLKQSTPFFATQIYGEGGIGSPMGLSLRGITKVGKFWYFSIYDASLNSSFWVQLKDGDRELAMIKAEFFDDENKELAISTNSYSHVLALKERDPLTGPVPNLPGSYSGRGNGQMNRGQQMQQMFSNMSNEQKAAMAMQLGASMMMGNQQGQQGQQGQMGKQGQMGQQGQMSGNNQQGNNKNSSGNKSSSGKSSSGGKR